MLEEWNILLVIELYFYANSSFCFIMRNISGDKMVLKGNRERMCKYVTIYPQLNRVVHGVVDGVVYGVAVRVFNFPIHMHVQKMKFQEKGNATCSV